MTTAVVGSRDGNAQPRSMGSIPPDDPQAFVQTETLQTHWIELPTSLTSQVE